MSWQAIVLALLALVVLGGFAWYERSHPPARLVALVAALAALAVAGRLVLAPIPNVVATTDVALITGYALGGPPGFAVGALAAPISNIWLGQGPWTAWQMAGWGLVGLGGAWLAAASGGRLGRWGLAIACGLAGLAYGALLDLSVMVTYGGEQSLDRYLALSARGIPFNLAHAAGNFVIGFVAGPALVRMVSRYRTRFEFSWSPAGALPLALILIGLVAASVAPVAGAAGDRDAKAEPLAVSARWLARTQNRDGGFGATADYPSSPAMTGWVMLGLEGAQRNPLDVRNRGTSPVAYLREEIDRLGSPGDLERTILALEGAGVDARAFGDTDLVAELRARRRDDGSVRGQVNLTAFYVLAMRSAGVASGDLGRTARWLREARNRNGGWGFRPTAPSDPDSTGAALQALAAAGAGEGATASEAAAWLRRAQRGDGGYALATSGVVNAQSTAWAIQGLLAVDAGGRQVHRALATLERLRAADGHYRYSESSDQTPVWVTAQALMAVGREPMPIEAVDRAPANRDASTTTSGEGAAAEGTAGTGTTYPTPAPSLSGPTVSGAEFGDYGDALGGGGAAAARAASGARGASARGGGDARGTRGEGGPGGGEPQPASDLGTLAERMIAASTEFTPAVDPDDEPVAPYVAGGLGLLALGLGGGYLWYRRRLP